jgi:hypothetical protein
LYVTHLAHLDSVLDHLLLNVLFVRFKELNVVLSDIAYAQLVNTLMVIIVMIAMVIVRLAMDHAMKIA